MGIGMLVLVWVLCAVFLGPLIGLLGLNRSHEEEAQVTPEQWRLRIHHLLGYVGLLGGTAGILYLVGRRSGEAEALLILLVFGYPILIVILALVARLLPSLKARNGFYLVLCAALAVGLLSFRADRQAAAEKVARTYAIMVEIAAIDRQAIREWIEDLHAAGAHGAPGEIPPMLQVDDTGDGAQVKNLASRSFCLRIFRQSEQRNTDNPTRCTLLSRKREGDCTRLGPGDSEWFELLDLPDRQACVGKPLSFKLGDRSDPEIVWWSDPEIELLKAELRHPPGHYGATGRFTLEETHAGYRALLRQGDRASLWRAHIAAAERVKSLKPADDAGDAPAAAMSAELSAVYKRIADLERLAKASKPGERGLPDYLKVSSDWKDEIVLANSGYAPKRVQLLRAGRDAEGATFFCAMRGGDQDTHGTLIPARESATFHRPSDSACPANKRLPLHAEVHDASGVLAYMSPELLDLRLAQAKQELRALERAGD